MTTSQANFITRRSAISALSAFAFSTTATFVWAEEEFDPTDLVPRRFSRSDFAQLSKNELHKVDLAVRRGRRILIDGFNASESRDIIQRAASNPLQAASLVGL